MSLRRAALAAAIVATVSLSGCISLLPKEKPVQLYRFGAGSPDAPAAPAPAAAPAVGGPTFAVRLATIGFDRPSATDRILTVNGDQTAYVAGARWVTSANALFGAAVTRAFDGHGGPARLLAFGEPSRADLILKIDVRTFEVVYRHGTGGEPEVVVRIAGALIDPAATGDDRGRLFEARAAASSNSVHALVAAFDKAVSEVLTSLVAWVDARGKA
jgi:cholesterol transport system auxiliary component